jgi:hypothetical protein
VILVLTGCADDHEAPSGYRGASSSWCAVTVLIAILEDIDLMVSFVARSSKTTVTAVARF